MSEVIDQPEDPKRRRRTQPREVDPLALTPIEAARALGISIDLMRDLIRDRKIPFCRIRSRVVLLPSDITAWLRSQRIGP